VSVADRDADARNLIHSRLAQSREELHTIFYPPPGENGEEGQASAIGRGRFPRSRTMQMLMSGRGLGTLGALAGGLLIGRPGLALRLLRLLPASALAKMFMARAVGALKSKSRDGA
jgi:hypothetical protein